MSSKRHKDLIMGTSWSQTRLRASGAGTWLTKHGGGAKPVATNDTLRIMHSIILRNMYNFMANLNKLHIHGNGNSNCPVNFNTQRWTSTSSALTLNGSMAQPQLTNEKSACKSTYMTTPTNDKYTQAYKLAAWCAINESGHRLQQI